MIPRPLAALAITALAAACGSVASAPPPPPREVASAPPAPPAPPPAPLREPGPTRVLLLDRAPGDVKALADALAGQRMNVDVHEPPGALASMDELRRYDFVILSDTPADAIPPASQAIVEGYVRAHGGGFLFAAGERGAKGWSGAPLEGLLPVRIADTARLPPAPVEGRRDAAIEIVLDRSEAMRGAPLEAEKRAALAAIDALAPSDRAGVLAAGERPSHVVRLAAARRRASVEADLGRLRAGGHRAIAAALEEAQRTLAAAPAARKHVVLVAGGTSPGAGLRELVASMSAEGIGVSVVGFGDGVDEATLRMIADIGGGRYRAARGAADLERAVGEVVEAALRPISGWFHVDPVDPTSPLVNVRDSGSASGPASRALSALDLDGAPALHGRIGARSKPPPAEILIRHHEHPLLARWRFGRGWALAWTSDVRPHWAIEWIRWPGWDRFWGRIVGEHARAAAP